MNSAVHHQPSTKRGTPPYSDGAPLGIKGPNGDVYLYTHLQVDAQASVRLASGFSALNYGLNLTNEVFGFYQGSGVYPIQREYYKATIGAGLRWTPAFESPTRQSAPLPLLDERGRKEP